MIGPYFDELAPVLDLLHDLIQKRVTLPRRASIEMTMTFFPRAQKPVCALVLAIVTEAQTS